MTKLYSQGWKRHRLAWKRSHFRMTNSSPDRRSTCLIHFPFPSPEPEFAPPAATCAISKPFPTGRNVDRTNRRVPLSVTFFHLKLESLLELAFLQIKTAPLELRFASFRTRLKFLLWLSTTIKSIPTSPSITSSGSPTITSGTDPALSIALQYSPLDLSSGTTHTCLPPTCRRATARPILVAIAPPLDHVSTMNCALHPAAIAEISSATPDSCWRSHFT